MNLLAQLSITPSHTCTPRPSHCLVPSPCLLFVCLYRYESLFFSLRCLCPALRIHNHTVLPSSHNSSYVYTNDSAYTNISATVGENPFLLFRSLKFICASPSCCPVIPFLYLHTVESHFSPRSSPRSSFLIIITYQLSKALRGCECFMRHQESRKTLMFISCKNDL